MYTFCGFTNSVNIKLIIYIDCFVHQHIFYIYPFYKIMYFSPPPAFVHLLIFTYRRLFVKNSVLRLPGTEFALGEAFFVMDLMRIVIE